MKWWEDRSRWIADEQARFRAGGLSFELDSEALDDGVVVFRGDLRKGTEVCPATVVYPSGYGAGQSPAVVAPELPIDRHKGPDGTLCLDHPSPDGSDLAPMTGAEAVEAAEELWRISLDDPDALREREADAPDPRIEHYLYEAGSALILIDADVTGHPEGYMRFGLTSAQPLRGALTGLGYGITAGVDIKVPEENSRLAGRVQVSGLWRRLDSPPAGRRATDLAAWAQAEHGDLLAKAQALGAAGRQLSRQQVPALVAFVFPDEGPARGAYHDEWIVLSVSSDGEPQLVRAYSILRSEHWRRQPQLEPLGAKRIGIVGSGALGSQVDALLVRAGVGDVCGVDSDILTPGNRVRHESDLGEVGLHKIQALAQRSIRVNPYVKVTGHGVRLGGSGGADPLLHRRAEQEALADLAGRDLIVNATAHIVTGYFLSAFADRERVPLLHVMVSSGAWSGRVLLQRHDRSGCLECLARHQAKQGDSCVEVPAWTEDPEFPQAMDLGCGQASFTGPGFEITETGAAAVRVAVQALLDGTGYPAADFDLVTLRLRDAHSARPGFIYTRLPRHTFCKSCS
jgi:molybdopterin/thiamine biosynthesis adenylyltransferase